MSILYPVELGKINLLNNKNQKPRYKECTRENNLCYYEFSENYNELSFYMLGCRLTPCTNCVYPDRDKFYEDVYNVKDLLNEDFAIKLKLLEVNCITIYPGNTSSVKEQSPNNTIITKKLKQKDFDDCVNYIKEIQLIVTFLTTFNFHGRICLSHFNQEYQELYEKKHNNNSNWK